MNGKIFAGPAFWKKGKWGLFFQRQCWEFIFGVDIRSLDLSETELLDFDGDF